MAQQLVWKAWRVATGDLEQTLNDMQQSGFSIYNIFPFSSPTLSCGYTIVASRFVEETTESMVGIPVDATTHAAYQSLPPAEQTAMQVLLGGMVTRYYQKIGLLHEQA